MFKRLSKMPIFSLYAQREILICGLLSFSSGFSVLLIMSTIPIWLLMHGVDKTTIGLFNLAYLPYVLKIIWAPIMDICKVPILGRIFGHLRGWAILMQVSLIGVVLLLPIINPKENIMVAVALVTLLAFFSTNRDIMTDAYRIEILSPEQIGPGSAMYLFGYRVGMLLSSSLGLCLYKIVSWGHVFMILAGILVLGLVTLLYVPEPEIKRKAYFKRDKNDPNSRWLPDLRERLSRATVDPLKEFMTRPWWLVILLMIPVYKLGDNFVQNMSNIFFIEIGFSGFEIAATVKGFGLMASIFGSLWGGIIVSRMGDVRAMLFYGIIHMLSFGLYALQAAIGDNLFLLTITIAVTHITGGIVTTAFVSFISNLCHRSYRVTQYALFSSLRSLDKCLVFPSGFLATYLGWTTYFLITPLFGVPALLILLFLIYQRGDLAVKALALREELSSEGQIKSQTAS